MEPNNKNQNRHAPANLEHKPIITVDYESKDISSDAKFLSIGKATWDPKDYSIKVWRKSCDVERWSRQSEELPLWRIIDMATLLVAYINQKHSNLNEFIQDSNSISELNNYIQAHRDILAPKLKELSNMINGLNLVGCSNNLPNIFTFATSELSQDAMFAWLIQCADSNNRQSDIAIYKIAKSFVAMLLGSSINDNSIIKVRRQWNDIDLCAEINEDTFLIIEDKTNTSIHDNQLERYKEIVEKEYKGKRSNLLYIYIKTGNEPLSVLKRINDLGYKTISRINIIDCLGDYHGDNFLLLNFIEHLKSIEKETKSYLELPYKKWSWYAWQGFYKELESRFDDLSWDYVPNQSGGFLGAWWHYKYIADEDLNMYLQFEQEKLCFKIDYKGKENSKVRYEKYRRIIELAKEKHHPEIKKPSRFGKGKVMSIAVVDSDYLFGKDLVNLEELASKLREYQSLIDQCCKK